MPASRRARLALRVALAALIAAPLIALVAANLYLNLWLPGLLDRRPDRLSIGFDYAWFLLPSDVHVHGLAIAARGATDAWRLTADDASAAIDVGALREHRFIAKNLRGSGVAFAYGPRRGAVEAPREHIGAPWSVSIDGATLADVRDLSFGDYHLAGAGSIPTASLALDGSKATVQATFALEDMAASHLADPLAAHVEGRITLGLDGFDPKGTHGAALLDALTAEATLDADVGSLDFLDYYLEKAQWLHLSGAGHVHADVRNDRGRMLPGSALTVEAPGMRIGFLDWSITGDCRVELAVDADPPGTRLGIAFTEYAVRSGDNPTALVEGDGFTIAATTPDTSFAEPFTSLDVDLDLPTSAIPSFRSYTAFFPDDVGMRVSGGRGTLRGHVHATTRDNTASGDLYLTGSGVELRLGEVKMVSNVTAHGRLALGRLDRGIYDISGTSVDFTDVAIDTPKQPDAGTTGWTASMSVPSGSVHVGARTFFDAHFAMKCRDSTPFLTMFAEKRALPDLARRVLTIRDISGDAHLRLGTDTVDIDSAAFRGNNFELLMHLRRAHSLNYGALFARLGPAAVAVGVEGAAKHVQVAGARSWYDDGPDESDFRIAGSRDRAADRAARKATRKGK